MDIQRAATYRPGVSGPHQKSSPISTVVADLDGGRTPDAVLLATAVRELLRALAVAAPGRSVEVRVPPYGAVQCVPGPRHARGTPPNVVETDPVTWVEVATGRLTWVAAIAEGRVSASGPRTDLSQYLPLSDT
jgi:hypothetical protein